MANFSGSVISDTAIVRMSVDTARRSFAFNKFPFLSMLPKAKAKGDQTHEWLDAVEGLVRTQLNMSAGMTGGSSSEAITVDSTADFAVNQSVMIMHDGTNSPQSGYISVITDTTTMTVITCDGDNWSTFADNTYVLLGGDFVDYGTTVNHNLRQATRAYNTIEQISVSVDISRNIESSDLIDGSPVMAMLTREAFTQYKEKATVAGLFGEQVTNTDSAKKGKMKGLYNFIPSANVTSATITKAHVRSAIFDLRDRDAFPDAEDANANWLVCNSAFVEWFMSLDDSSTGLSQKKTDAGFTSIRLGGVMFSLIHDRAMVRGFPANKPATFMLTARDGGKALIKWAAISNKDANSKEKYVLETAVQTTLQVAQFACLEVKDTFKQGLFVASDTI